MSRFRSNPDVGLLQDMGDRARALKSDPWTRDAHSRAVAQLLEDLVDYISWMEEKLEQEYDGE